jgi:hypothetical protein
MRDIKINQITNISVDTKTNWYEWRFIAKELYLRRIIIFTL